MTVAYIGIGSNVGDRIGFCRAAVGALDGSPSISTLAVSGLYETSPIGGPPQRSFVNLVVKVETELGPRALLEACKDIEQKMGREPSDLRWGPRVVDLDLLLYGREKVSEPDLEVPHPRLKERRFALVPLLEIDPDLTDPWETRLDDSLEEAEGDVELLEPF
ncbi:MAG TPA: 2-amino-4-hydroxy-6-hydroxymethyldihydropteridine diphosphokinase [Actinomycetota bacterium]|nr:2-amino-4-hydroxy-6-hydroxymethyldihydropteridine diphosphokinase [Actinomycetota bacterium]